MPKTIKTKFDPTGDFVTVGENSPNVSEGTITSTYNSSLDLLAWWKFDHFADEEGTIADSSGNGHTATPYDADNKLVIYGGTTPSFRIQDSSCYFDGDDGCQIVENPSDNSLSFTDGSDNDKPFSVSFWVFPDFDETLGIDYGILTKGGHSARRYEYRIFFEDNALATDADVYFMLSDSDGSTTGDYIGKRKLESISKNQWNHVTFTYDGSNSASGMIVYVNGVDVSAGDYSLGSYDGMKNTGLDLAIGASNTLGSFNMSGYVAAFCIWNKELSVADVQALYESKYGSYQMMTGYLNNPYKTVISDRDNMTGSYPTILRTTGRRSTSGKGPGGKADPFDDTRVVNFESSSEIVYPFVLTKYDTTKYESNWVASPNLSSSSGSQSLTHPTPELAIIAPGTASAGVSDQGITPSVRQGLQYEPFAENRIYLEDTPFYLVGTDPSVYPNFGSRLADKVQIKIGLGSVADSIVSRYSLSGTSAQRASSNYINHWLPNLSENEHTGFLYYNPSKRLWEDIGLTDPQTGATLSYNSWYIENSAAGSASGLTWAPPNPADHLANYVYGPENRVAWKNDPYLPRHFKPYQFSMSSHIGFTAFTYGLTDPVTGSLALLGVGSVSGSNSLESMGYSKIGSPTVSGMAPFSNMYYATSSQRIQMSEYISHPFVLEKAVIDIPVTVQMWWENTEDKAICATGSDGTGVTRIAATDLPVEGSSRDIDNYTFFIYRQTSSPGSGPRFAGSGSGEGSGHIHYNKGAIIDSPTAISSSRRYLIASGCAAFWNGGAFNEKTVRQQIFSSSLPHVPAFSYNMNPDRIWYQEVAPMQAADNMFILISPGP